MSPVPYFALCTGITGVSGITIFPRELLNLLTHGILLPSARPKNAVSWPQALQLPKTKIGPCLGLGGSKSIKNCKATKCASPPPLFLMVSTPPFLMVSTPYNGPMRHLDPHTGAHLATASQHLEPTQLLAWPFFAKINKKSGHCGHTIRNAHESPKLACFLASRKVLFHLVIPRHVRAMFQI